MFLYFIPTPKHQLAREDLPEPLQWIWHDVDGAPWANNPLRSPGPGNQQGTIVSLGKDARYLPDRQQWQRSFCGQYHVGWNSSSPPTPEQLLRSRPLDGTPYRLGDGNDWLIPILHGPCITIPRAYGFGPNGERVLQAIPQYAQLLAKSEEWVNVIHGQSESHPSFDDWFDFAAQLVGVNYRVGPEECAALNLIQVQAAYMIGVLKVCLGLDALAVERELQKKTATPPDGSAANPPEPAAAASR